MSLVAAEQKLELFRSPEMAAKPFPFHFFEVLQAALPGLYRTRPRKAGHRGRGPVRGASVRVAGPGGVRKVLGMPKLPRQAACKPKAKQQRKACGTWY